MDLDAFRKEHQQYSINKTMNEKITKTVRTRFKTFYIMGMIFYIFAILFLSISFYFLCRDDKKGFIYYSIFIFVILLIFSLFGVVKSCININKFNKAKEIDILNNYDNIRTINLLYVIFGFIINGLFIAIFLTEFIVNKYKSS